MPLTLISQEFSFLAQTSNNLARKASGERNPAVDSEQFHCTRSPFIYQDRSCNNALVLRLDRNFFMQSKRQKKRALYYSQEKLFS